MILPLPIRLLQVRLREVQAQVPSSAVTRVNKALDQDDTN
jgi:hypothetical protein